MQTISLRLSLPVPGSASWPALNPLALRFSEPFHGLLQNDVLVLVDLCADLNGIQCDPMADIGLGCRTHSRWAIHSAELKEGPLNLREVAELIPTPRPFILQSSRETAA
jgi:hypothetical protein